MPPRTSPLTRHAADVVVHIDVKSTVARRKRWKELIDRVHTARKGEAVEYDAYWEAIGEILDAQLYVDGGYDTAEAFLKAEVKEPKRTAVRHIRVARHATPAEEAKYGTTILDAALSFIEAKTGGPIDGPLPIRFESLRIPVTTNGKTHHVPLEEATQPQINAATTALLRATGKTKVHRSPSHAAIAEALSKKKSLASVAVHVSGGMLRLGAIPLWAVKDLVEALRGVRLPADPGEAGEVAAKKRGSRAPTRRARA